MCRIFISHANKDCKFINKNLIKLIDDSGVQYFFSEKNLRMGVNWVTEVFQNLQRCDYFLLVMSKNSLDSEWVKAEIKAWRLKKRESSKGKSEPRIFPVIIDDCKPEEFHFDIPSNIMCKKLENKEFTQWLYNIKYESKPTSAQPYAVSDTSQVDTNFNDELIGMLDRENNEFWECVDDAYRLFLSSLSSNEHNIFLYNDYLAQNDKSLKAFILATELSYNWVRSFVITDFLARLHAYLSNNKDFGNNKFQNTEIENILEAINEIAKINSQNYYSDFKTNTKRYQQQLQQARAYLMIQIEESFHYPDRFIINAWYATTEMVKESSSDLKNVDIYGHKENYSLKELKEVIHEFVDKVKENIRYL